MNDPTAITQEAWQQINLFFMEQGNIYETLRKLHQQLTGTKISYAVIGGMALALRIFPSLVGFTKMIRYLD